MALTERTQDQLRDMQEKMTSLFHYMRERDEAIQSYFQELLPDEMPLFPVFPSELFHTAQPAKRKAPQDQAAPQPPLKKKKVPSTSTATPPVRPPTPEEREEPVTPHADTATSIPKPPAKTATASKRTLTRKDKGKAPVRASPRAPAPEATVELDGDDDHDDDMPDAPPPPAPQIEPTIPRRRIKRKANRNISTADLAAEENVASEAEDDGSSTTPEETPNPNPPSSKARYKPVATKQTPNSHGMTLPTSSGVRCMLHAHLDLIACEGLVLLEKGVVGGVVQDNLEKTTKNAPIPAYTWTFEPAVPACGRTFLVAEMLQHTGVQNRQSAEKTKQPRYFAAHMAPLQELTSPIKGTLKELKRGLGRNEREEKVKRGDLRERKLAAASSSTSRPHHC
ncbi:hypothetical protein GQ457_15G019210 [Hibiscus cannabinus]